MIIDEVHILPSEKTPEVFLNPEGIITIRGRGLTLNKNEVPDQILSWIDSYLKNPADITYLVIAFEYLNSYSTATLFMILRKISNVILRSKKLIIKWYYEEDDDDILERGEYIEAALNIPFEFIIAHKEAEN
jgi:hypothetical protein